MKRREFVHRLAASTAALPLSPRWMEAPRRDRMQWWREARFGMFVHFGLYSGPGGEWKGRMTGSHEWMRNNAKIPHEEYITLARDFNPTAFDADAIVRLARDAGQQYVVFTTKHHEGFSLFDTRVSTYGVMHTPYGRDIARAMADACRRHGLRLGWYYSIMDWYHPDYLPRRDWEQRDATGADFTRYLAFMQAQLRELLTQYGDVSVLWFDGQWESTWTHALAVELEQWCRRFAPDVVINDRIDVGVPQPLPPGYRRAGDYTTPELMVPEKGMPGVDWETCMTMNDNWGYAKDDSHWKTVPQLVRLLVETASKGGNLLLNVGPDGTGRVPEQSIDGLKGVATWMRTNASAIHSTTATPFEQAPVRVTTKGARLHLFIDEWKGGALTLPGLRTAPRAAHLLGDPSLRVATRTTDTGVELTLPERGPGTVMPVIALDFPAAPRVNPGAGASRSS